ncbi:hypothetical protein [Corynebacterium gerontici]|uniref:Lipoprotein n=1 Tax=Corynebacterium gerontici TaxID=2079234 RepID=A0A3G6J3F9_9CORY|nr:hypothetical protein [Corynebacterium gerontici]AZA10940.1 hypothetical protein CGERO_03085 [Corynebacterium gerontici]
MRFSRLVLALPLALCACSSGYQAHLSAAEDVLRIEVQGASFVEEGSLFLKVGSEQEALPTEAPANGFGGVTHFEYELENEHVVKVQSHKSGPTDRMWRGPFGECVMRENQADYSFEHAAELVAVLEEAAKRC